MRVLSRAGRTGSGGHGGGSSVPVVPAAVKRMRPRTVGGRCGQDSGGGDAQAEDGPSSPHAEAVQGQEPAASAGAEPGLAEGQAAVVGGRTPTAARVADDGARGAAA